MLELTVAADLALRIAALEAQRGQSDAISVDHLLIGLLSLEKLVDASGGLAPDQQAAVSTEQQLLLRALSQVRLGPTTVRRLVRSEIPARRAQGERAVTRDPACLAAFERAGARAEWRGAATCGILDLLAALLEQPSRALSRAIGDPHRLNQ